jgi:hypothetical protein
MMPLHVVEELYRTDPCPFVKRVERVGWPYSGRRYYVKRLSDHKVARFMDCSLASVVREYARPCKHFSHGHQFSFFCLLIEACQFVG